jgi:ferric-dicitrate binding protein FerR (iron transport regulator)
MLWFSRKKKRKPKTDAEILAEAFEEIGASQKKRRRRKRRALLWRRYVNARVFLALGIIAAALIAEGVRRENMEFYATVAQLSGSGTVRLTHDAHPQPLALNQRIADGGKVVTGGDCWASLDFPDGSVVILGPGSELVVELLEYNRGGMWRSRAFTLNTGHLWTRVSSRFGQASHHKVHTPSSVAAVRGTRFYVHHNRNRLETSVLCNDGIVVVEGFQGGGAILSTGRATSVRYGGAPARVGRMDPRIRQGFGSPMLSREIPPDPWLKRITLKLTNILDMPLSLLGIGKSSWALGAADYARRNAAMEAMRKLHTSIEGYRTYPEFVDPFTLAELDFRPEDARKLLMNFDGRSLVKYERVGQNYVIYARARDKERTPFRLTTYGVEQITEAEVPAF